MPNCKQCNTGFELMDADRKVLQKFNAPEPTLCPDCRMQRRVSFRNEMNFHKAKCELTGKSILTNIPPDQGYKIMSSDVWYTDQWDPLSHGRDFDFNRPFFEQMDELIRAVPHLNVVSDGTSENCDYCNFTVNGKDCYLCGRIANAEQAYYSYLSLDSLKVFDSYYTRKCQECYEAVDCSDCYRVWFSQRLQTCRNVSFSMDCIGCEDCFGCYGLRHKKYHFFNRPLSREDYFKALENLNLGSQAFTRKMQNKFYQEEVLKSPVRAAIIENSENAVGNYIFNSRNVYGSFDVNDSEDVRYSWGVLGGRDTYDTYAPHLPEECYNTVSVSKSQMIRYSYATYNHCYDLEYCFEAFNNVKNCFGCVGLKHKQFCIFNKQYSEAEYHVLKTKIIEYMQRTGEYGEYFPMTLSPFAYNETVAQEYFPLTRGEVEAQGLLWFEEQRDLPSKKYEVPDHIRDVKDDIVEAVLVCEKTGRPYKVIPQELKFLREHHIPIPRLCPYERHIARIHSRAPRKLWNRTCVKCGATIKTVYSPERPEQVVCETCYLKEVY